MALKKKQSCGYCPEDKYLLDCEICNPKKGKSCNYVHNDNKTLLKPESKSRIRFNARQ